MTNLFGRYNAYIIKRINEIDPTIIQDVEMAQKYAMERLLDDLENERERRDDRQIYNITDSTR